jgi:uncharacterized membrane protein
MNKTMIRLSPATARLALQRVLLPLLLLVNLLLLLHYVVLDYRVVTNSDSAVMNLLAQEIHDTGQWIPRAWNYANGDLWLLFTHTVIVPLLYVLPNSYALHAVSSLVTAVLVLGCVWWSGALLGQSRMARLLLLAVFSGGMSVVMAENLYGQAAYGLLFAQVCLLCCASWRFLHARGAARWGWGAGAGLLLLLLFWSNPQRALVYYGLPLALATLAMRLQPSRPEAHVFSTAGVSPQRQNTLLLALLAAALVTGTLLHNHYMNLVGNSGLAPATWLRFDEMGRNLAGTLEGLLSVLGGKPPAGKPVINAAGVWAALRLAAAATVLALLPWALRRSLRAHAPRHRGRLFFGVFTLASAAVPLFMMLATSLPDMADPQASVRYLVPALLCLIMLLGGIAVDECSWRSAPRLAGVAALSVLALSAVQAYRVQNAPGPGKLFKRAQAPRSDSHLSDFLVSHGLQYGYGEFWVAGNTTLLGRQRVRLRQIAVSDGLPQPVRHLSSDRWYQASYWSGPTFLLLTPEQMKAIDWPRMAQLLGEPERRLQYNERQVLVYPFNIASRLPLWDYAQPVPLRFPASAATGHHIGQFDPAGARLLAQPGETGWLTYGVRRNSNPGNYVATFELDSGAAAGVQAGRVEVAAAGGSVVLASAPISQAGAHNIKLPFRLSGPAPDLELRIHSNGVARLATSGTALLALDPRRVPLPTK